MIQFYKITLLVAASFLLKFTASAQCAAIDQSQLNYNGGMSARNLAQYSEWQWFTAGVSGMLCQIDVGFFNDMNGTGVFKIFEGTGTGGTLLQSQNVTVAGTGNFFHTFSVSAPVTAGMVYTFQFIPIQGGGLPDPYGVQVRNPGTYAGGEMYITDPSGTYATGFDMVFKTYVTLSTAIASADVLSSALLVFPNPVSDKLTVSIGNYNNVPLNLNIYSATGQLVHSETLRSNQQQINVSDLSSGMYMIEVSSSSAVEKQKLIIQR